MKSNFRMRKRLLQSGVLILAAVASACNPCIGIDDCQQSVNPAVEGRILVGESGVAVPGATVSLYPAAASPTTSTTSDKYGLFSARSADNTSGPLALRVVAPGTAGYVIDSLPCGGPFHGGDACVLPPITPLPWVPLHFLITYRGSTEPLSGVPVRFIRTGGSQWLGKSARDTFAMITDSTGIALPFPLDLAASSLDPVVGDLVADLPGALGRSTRKNFLVGPIYLFYDRPLGIFQMGPSLRYGLVFVDSATSVPVSGVDLTFARVAGIPVEHEVVEVTSGGDGTAVLPLRALAVGTVEGRVVMRVPSRSVADTTLVTLPTFDNDSTRILSRWKVGATGRFYPIAGQP